jgi:TatD DNase family protein
LLKFFLFWFKKQVQMPHKPLYDSHIHITRLPHPRELAQELDRIGYAYAAVACEPGEWEPLWELWQDLDLKNKGCNLAFGIHPMAIAQATEPHKAELRRILERESSFMVGEAGLDRRFPEYGAGELQEQWFTFQAELALELKRNLQIHCVGDYGRAIALLKQAGFGKTKEGPRPIFHRFGGDAGTARQILAMGGLLSVHASTLTKKSSRMAVAELPKEVLLFETDADESFIGKFFCEGEPSTGDIAQKLLSELRDVREAAENL